MFAASVLVALLNSSVIHASCGDYVYSRFRTPTHHGSIVYRRVEVNRLEVATSQIVRAKIEGLRGDVTETMPQPEAPAPCHGPNCSQNPTPGVPVAPSSTVGSANQDRLISGRLSAEFGPEVSLRRDLKSNARSRRGYPLLIDMPPEFAG